MKSAITIVAALSTIAAVSAAPTKACSHGQVWNDCGSPCTKTCDDPSRMCVAVCKARCECPRDKPLFKGGTCISLDECPASNVSTVNHSQVEETQKKPAPPCIPNQLPRCTREYHPVCAAGKTFANPCIAKAACHSKYELGECADPNSAWSAADPLVVLAAASNSKGRRTQGEDCADPTTTSCVSDKPSFWCRAFLECSNDFLYTWKCSGWWCGWCSWKWDEKTMCKSDRSLFCNGGGDQQCRP